MFFKEVDYLISEAEKSVEVTNAAEMTEVTTSTETSEQEDTCYIDRPLKSMQVQTLPVEYFGRSRGTQTKEESKTNVSKGTQTCITGDLLSSYFSKPKMASIRLQTDPVNLVMDKDKNADGDDENRKEEETVSTNTRTAFEVDKRANYSDQEQSDESDGEESCDVESWSDDCSMATEEDSEMEECTAKDKKLDNEPIILTSEKSVKDQLKFIICEESLVRTFGLCLKCGSRCSVLVTSIIGSYCKILISCSSSTGHNISWSTGPLTNRLPSFNLLIAASILSTGMELNKTIRFMESLNILFIERRELSNIQTAYVIPAVVSVGTTKIIG